MGEKVTCESCGKKKNTVSLQPSASALIFGGFRQTYTMRCQACETKLAKKLMKMLK